MLIFNESRGKVLSSSVEVEGKPNCKVGEGDCEHGVK